ncbi:MAG: glycosyltransferase [bacterium]|nr:glycosyltransferase [bacterium]
MSEEAAKRRIVHVLPRLREASGLAPVVRGYCAGLAERGASVHVHTLASEVEPSLGNIEPLGNIEHHEHGEWGPRRFGFSPALARAVRRAARSTRVVHGHGLWMHPNLVLDPARLACPLIVSPHGMLAPDARTHSGLRKRIAWRMRQRRVLSGACLHATCEAEYRDCRAAGLGGPVAVVPPGVDVLEGTQPSEREGPPYVLFVGRIHPIKNLEALLAAWASLPATSDGWELLIAGPPTDPAYERLLRGAAVPGVRFLGPVGADDKHELLGGASALVLPSHSENFGVVVGEALAAGVPVVVTRGAPWSGVERERCGWWVDADAEALGACLREVRTASRETLAAMGARGRAWMIREFAWSRVAGMLDETYAWLADGAERPAWVRVD